ncbi:hypothetical protein SEUCBS140593_009924 [Sporothrix eucalyptigena]|uniref:Uncharacterized protein n=1 Tax=Sporothrix eucalyptigena TaxID=1812306 RepID=A0ABP0CYW5_9PEZI
MTSFHTYAQASAVRAQSQPAANPTRALLPIVLLVALLAALLPTDASPLISLVRQTTIMTAIAIGIPSSLCSIVLYHAGKRDELGYLRAQGASQKDKSHWALVKTHTTFISETKKFSDNIATGTVGEGSSSGDGGGRIACGSEVASGSGAARPGRRQVLYLEPEMSMADRLVSLDTAAIY